MSFFAKQNSKKRYSRPLVMSLLTNGLKLVNKDIWGKTLKFVFEKWVGFVSTSFERTPSLSTDRS